MLWLNDLKNFGVGAVFGFPANKRKELREAIARELSPSEDELLRLKDLSYPPQLKKFSVSISHTQDFGGFVYTRRPAQIGWDVEIADRIRNSVVLRIASDEEMRAAPAPGFLWVAKEALFKALEDAQPKTMGELSIGDWRDVGDGLYHFRGRVGEGIARQEGAHLFAAVRIVSK